MADPFKSRDPYVSASLRIWAKHYKGNAPSAWLGRISGDLNKTPEGRRAVGAMSAGGLRGGMDYLKMTPLTTQHNKIG